MELINIGVLICDFADIFVAMIFEIVGQDPFNQFFIFNVRGTNFCSTLASDPILTLICSYKPKFAIFLRF